MRIIEQLVYKIQGDNSEFDKSITQSEGKVNKFASVADKMLAGVTVAAIGMVVKKAGDMVVAVAGATDRVDKMSQKIGISRKAFQEWDFILSQSGTSVDGLQMAVKTLSGAADEAMKGTKQYTDTFDRLGVSVTDINGKMKDQETLFAEVFSALANLDNQTERTAIANKLLGRSATELAPAFNAGGDAIEAMRTQAHELGLVMDDELIDSGVILTDNIDKLKRAYQGWKNQALEPLLGLAVTFTDKLLGQNTASKNLKTTYDTLQTAVTNYNTILDTSKGKTDAITQSMVSQAKAQMQLALQSASESYRKSSSELEKYSNTIQNSEKWISKYDKTLGQIAQSTGYTTEQLNLMTEQERLTAIAMAKGVEEGDRYNTIVLARKGYQEDLIKATTNLSQAEANQESFINLLTQGYISNNSSTKLLLDTYPELEQKVINNVEAYNKEQKAIKDRQKAVELAQKAFTAYDIENEQVLNRIIKMSKGHEDSAYMAELNRLATEKLNEVLAEKARLAETEAEKEEARAEIIANTTKAISDAEKVSIALGDAYDLTSAKAGIFTSAIETLIESGLEPSDDRVQTLIASLQELGTTTERVAFERLSLLATEEEAFLFSLKKQSEAYLEQGYELAEIDAWKEKKKEEFYANIEKLQEAQTKKAIEEAEKVKQVWVDASFGMLSSITSIWGSINQVQENQNQSEIQRIKEQNEATLESARLRGASEEELTELEKSLQADLNDTKNQYAKEESERKKAQATFSAIIDTASAIIGFLANPGGLAGWALSAGAVGIGAAQLAAINSAPVPSYDVGSIRIPETTQAVVHKDEMILTAPQAEQARREGITITPNNASGNSVNLVIYLDGKKIAENTVGHVNSGVYRIDARVVK